MSFGEIRTPGGYRMDEVRSALQKAVRRGEERLALMMVSEIDRAGYGAYAFRTLRLIASEDVGLGWPEGPAVIRALHETFLDVRREEKKRYPPWNSGGMAPLAHATMLLCRAKKSRAVDHAAAVFWVSSPAFREALQIEIPDWALDNHTARGRAMGRTEDSCYEETTRLENEAPDVPDPYRALADTVERYEPNRERREHSRLMRALHVAYAALDGQHGGDARGYALTTASRKYGRRITSSADLTNAEAASLLAELERPEQG